jgi:hypothetical protein
LGKSWKNIFLRKSAKYEYPNFPYSIFLPSFGKFQIPIFGKINGKIFPLDMIRWEFPIISPTSKCTVPSF